MKKDKYRSAKIIAINSFMAVLALTLSVLLLFFAMGYRVNLKGEIERAGLLQVRSKPSGAYVMIDDALQSSRTPYSKTISSGEHVIKIDKKGYGIWERKINVEPGKVSWLNYVRLLPLEMSEERFFEARNVTGYLVDSKHRTAVLYDAERQQFAVVDVRGGGVVRQSFYLKDILKKESYDGSVGLVELSANLERILVSYTDKAGSTEFLVVSLGDVNNAINLSTAFPDLELTWIAMNNQGDKLLVVDKKQNLREINVSGLTISSVLGAGIEKMEMHGDVALLVVEETVDDARGVWSFVLGDKGAVKIRDVQGEVDMAIYEYRGDKVVAVADETGLSVHSGALAKFGQEHHLTSRVGEEIAVGQLEFSYEGRFLLAQHKNGKQVYMYDFLDWSVVVRHDFDTVVEDLMFADEYLLAGSVNGRVLIMDFDGENNRKVFEFGEGREVFGFVISENGEWGWVIDNTGLSKIRLII